MKYKTWTTEEIEYLQKEYGRTNLDKISKKLGRTLSSVAGKAHRLKLGPSYEAQGEITAAELARSLGREKSTILRWIYNKELPSTHRKAKEKKKYQMIKIQDFWKWAEKNKNLMKWDLYERGSLPPEPKWIDEEIKNYAKNIIKKQKVKWSKSDESYLKFYYKQGKSISEIAKLLDRSEDAILCRIYKLKITKKVNISWRDIEIETLVSMRKNGSSFEEIAEELGRSEDGVKSRYKRLRKEGVVPICCAE